MFPERVKLNIESQIDGFEFTILERLLSSFSDIENEAKAKRLNYLAEKSKSFDPDLSDEACIEEDAYFEELEHLDVHSSLKTEFLNSSATWLFHLFERQKKDIFGTDLTAPIKTQLLSDGYDIQNCSDWHLLNKELRTLANAVKHGSQSDAAKRLSNDFSTLLSNDEIVVNEVDIRKYISALKAFWSKALYKKVVL
ncbi:hypothetical protein HQK29_23100 [Vibrio vulnificus]|nr:hypothetical protein [Vibrio vulnificus]